MIRTVILSTIVAMLCAIAAFAAPFSPSYSQLTISVASASSPTAVIPAGSQVTDWYSKPRASPSANYLSCWWFLGASVPTGTPSPAAVMEFAPGIMQHDQFVPPTAPPMLAGLACVLETGSTAQTVDSMWR